MNNRTIVSAMLLLAVAVLWLWQIKQPDISDTGSSTAETAAIGQSPEDNAEPETSLSAPGSNTSNTTVTETAIDCESDADDCDQVLANDTTALMRAAEQAYVEAIALEAMRNNPDTNQYRTVSEPERLAAYQTFQNEPVDASWGMETQNQLQTGIAQASNANIALSPDALECRSASCLVRFVRSPGDDPLKTLEDVSILLMLSGLKAKAEIKQTDVYSDVYLSGVSRLEKP